MNFIIILLTTYALIGAFFYGHEFGMEKGVRETRQSYEKFLELMPDKTEKQIYFHQGVAKAIQLFEDSSR